MPDVQGTVSPITSSSSMHEEESDNHTEYYVKKPKDVAGYEPAGVNESSSKCATCKFFQDGNSCSIVQGNIEPGAVCKFYQDGGDKMSNKGLDVDESVTTDTSYNVPGTSTTEPDPLSETAMKKLRKSLKETRKELKQLRKGAKGATYTQPATVDGVGKYGTVANTTVDAPSPGQTTEPVASVNKSEDLTCGCLAKADCATCLACSADMQCALDVTKSEEAPSEPTPVTKSIWAGAWFPE